MKRLLGAFGFTVVLFSLCSPVRADDPKVTAILDKAIKALGGQEKLGKAEVVTWKAKGKLTILRSGKILYNAEDAGKLPQLVRLAAREESNPELSTLLCDRLVKEGTVACFALGPIEGVGLDLGTPWPPLRRQVGEHIMPDELVHRPRVSEQRPQGSVDHVARRLEREPLVEQVSAEAFQRSRRDRVEG